MMFIKIFIFLLGLILTTQAIAAVQVEVDKTSIASDEMVTLTITSHDHLTFSPDLEPLKRDFDVVGTSQNSQFNIINGSTKMQVQWQVLLLPKRSGDLVIPQIQVGNEKTQSEIVHVSALKSSPAVKTSKNSSGNSDIFIEASINPREAFVQEQFVYTIKLFFDRSIENAYLMAPDLQDAKINQNGQDIVYSTTKNGRYYRVLERSYLITPLKTGHFQIQPPILKGYLEGSTDMIDVYGLSANTVRPLKVSGPIIEISVKAKPANFKGQWLPAKNVVIKESWEQNPPVFREGEPVTRIIEVTADGASAEQIPNVTAANLVNGNSYMQPPKRDTDIVNGMQVGKMKQKIVYIPTAAGKITIPGVKIHWWNSKSQREEVATLGEQIVRVLPALNKPQASNTPVATSQIDLPTLPQTTVTRETKPTNWIWPIIAVAFLVGWLLTIFFWRRQHKSLSTPIKKKATYNQKELTRMLKEACSANNPKRARDIFLKWGRNHWKNPEIHSLSDITQVLDQEQAQELSMQIMKLEASFYSKQHRNWDGTGFWQALNSYLQQNHDSGKDDEDPLPPLYCTEPS